MMQISEATIEMVKDSHKKFYKTIEDFNIDNKILALDKYTI